MTAVGRSTKALRIETKEELLEFWPRLRGLSKPAVAQKSIPGPETAVVSHHVHVDEKGEVAGEFTGRKIRTIPAEYGHTSSLTITDDPEVAGSAARCAPPSTCGASPSSTSSTDRTGASTCSRSMRAHALGTPGRAGRGEPCSDHVRRPHRRPRPEPRTTRACLDWVHPKDVLAARANGISMAEWLRWMWRTHPVTGVWRWDDPGPLLGMLVVRVKGAALGTSAAIPD